jgi:Fe-S-cluster containining protein
MLTTKLMLSDKLPLTCSRKGTCCHGNLVFLNPWELVCLAKEKKISPREFRALYCDLGGIRLRFEGEKDYRGKSACNQYVENFGCSVHLGRPLACRLFPIGRQIQSEEVNYIFQGTTFPCLDGCPEVVELPNLSVEEYLNGQETEQFENAQDEYLELMQNIADIAFTLLLDTELAASGDQKTLQVWRKHGTESPDSLAEIIGEEWLEALLLPDISNHLKDSTSFVQAHNELLQAKAQAQFGELESCEDLHAAACIMMAIALYLAKGIGADPKSLSEHWIATAKSHGALE